MAELYNLLSPKLLGICLRYFKDRTEAEDVMQDSMVKIFTRLNEFRFEGSFEGWAKRITVNMALNQLQKNNRIKFVYELETQDDKVVEEEEIIGVNEQEIFLCLNQLPLGYRTIFNLYLFEDFSHGEIAAKLKITESTSRSQYARARKMMAERLSELIRNKDVKLV